MGAMSKVWVWQGSACGTILDFGESLKLNLVTLDGNMMPVPILSYLGNAILCRADRVPEIHSYN